MYEIRIVAESLPELREKFAAITADFMTGPAGERTVEAPSADHTPHDAPADAAHGNAPREADEPPFDPAISLDELKALANALIETRGKDEARATLKALLDAEGVSKFSELSEAGRTRVGGKIKEAAR